LLMTMRRLKGWTVNLIWRLFYSGGDVLLFLSSVHQYISMGIILQILSEKAGSSIPWWSVPEIPKRVWCRVWGGCQSFAFTNSYRVPLGLQKKFTLLHCFFPLAQLPFPMKDSERALQWHWFSLWNYYDFSATPPPPSAFDIRSAHTLSFLTNNSDMHTYFS
jgi:hypothetical protein